jgi:hypothetical protein
MYQVEFSEDKPQEETDGQSVSTYNVSMTISTQFNYPSKLFLKYPVIINNKEIHENFIPSSIAAPYRAMDGRHSTYDIERMRDHLENFIHINKWNKFPKRIPFYDDWCVPLDSPLLGHGYDPFLIVSFTLDGPTTLLDIQGELNPDTGLKLRDEIITILQFQKDNTFRFSSLINATVFSGDKILDHTLLSLLPSGNIEVKCNLKSRLHHLVLSYVGDPTRLNRDLPWEVILEDDALTPFFKEVMDPEPTPLPLPNYAYTKENDTIRLDPMSSPDPGLEQEEIILTTGGQDYAHGSYQTDRFFIWRTMDATIIPKRRDSSES